MCVITICRSKRETEENLRAMEEANKDGTGVIFYKNGMPFYKKNIDIKEVLELNKTLKFPYAFHFRFTTVGQNKLLTHPFEVTPDSELKPFGSAKTLLMHNGHWANWDDTLHRYCLNALEDLPDGDWSDSRAMAFIAAKLGPNVLKTLTTQKIAFFSEKENIILLGNGWTKENGIAYSNKTWSYRTKSYGYGTYVVGQGWRQQDFSQLEDRESEKERRADSAEDDKRKLRALQVGKDKVE